MPDDTTALLREIRDNQQEALRLQREHMALYQRQLDRVEHINDRAEAIQARSLKAVRVILWIALALALVVLASLLWPWLRYWLPG